MLGAARIQLCALAACSGTRLCRLLARYARGISSGRFKISQDSCMGMGVSIPIVVSRDSSVVTVRVVIVAVQWWRPLLTMRRQ